MLYLFTGNSEYLVRAQVKAWKEKFVEKHGDFNLLHIKDLSEVDSNFLQENLTAPSFFGAKKLVIVDGVPFQSGEKDKQMLEKQDLILRLLSRVPDDNFVVFSSVSPDKRSTAYKEMLKIAEVKEYSLSDSGEVERKISELYRGVIDLDAIRLLVRYTGGNFEKAIHEIEKLMITRNTITRNDIQRYVTPELEESIFQLVDMLLEGNTHRAIQMMHTILDQTNVYGFYHNLLANLRTNTYIALVKSQRKDPRQVLDLGNKGFLAQKPVGIGGERLIQLYSNLVLLDKQMKTGKFLGTEDSDFIYELEKAILTSTS